MRLPDYVLACVNALEAAGFQAWAVGGCVRDAWLGLTPHDYDLCTDALPDQIRQVFSGYDLVLAGTKHGTVGVITGGGVVEITTFRREGGYRDNRHPDWVEFVQDIEADLARRDFTVNAMAWSPTRGFADPFGGRQDLQDRILRAVGEPERRFEEDSLRILRGVRFAVRYRLTPEAATERAMKELAHLMDNLARERVFEELCKLISLVGAEDLLRYAGVLAAVIPELAPMIGFDQHSPHHAYDLYTHTAQVCAGVPSQLALRWAGLLHDVGKIPTFTLDENGRGHFYGHAQASAGMAEEILRRLKAPAALREEVVFLIDKHMAVLEPDRKLLRRWISRWGVDRVIRLHALQQADFGSKGTGGPEGASWFEMIAGLIDSIREEDACLSLKDLAVNGRDLMALGLQGKAVGTCLDRLLEQVVDEVLPNEKEALLAAAKEMAAT